MRVSDVETVSMKADACSVISAQQAQNLLERQEVHTDKRVPEGKRTLHALESCGMSVSNYRCMLKTEVVIRRESESHQDMAISFPYFYIIFI